MKRSLRKMVAELRMHWRSYLLQSLLATLVVYVMLAALRLENVVIVASLGSTAFIVFAMPKSLSAQARNVIGGQLVGVACGSLGALVLRPGSPYAIAVYALAVGLSILVMVVTDTEHPPASGTALGIVTAGISLQVTIAVITGAVILSLIHHVAKERLRDLT